MKQLLIVLLIIMGHQALAKPERKKEQAKPERKEVQTKLEMREDEQINPKGREEEQVSTDFPFVQPKSERMEEEQAKPEGKEEHEQVSMLNLTMMSRSNGWPSGTYGLPKPKSSCPPSFKYGNRYHDTEDEDSYNGWSRNYLGGYRKRNNLRQDFCIKKSSSGSGNWPKGDYCIYKYGSCPPGFSDGSIYLDDEDSDNANKKSGSLPDGDYGRNTRYDYCCRNDESRSTEMDLPTGGRFYLFPYSDDQCQQVKGMTSRLEWIRFDTEDGYLFGPLPRDESYVTGNHPYVVIKHVTFKDPKIYYCYYY